MPFKPEFKHLERGVTPFECQECHRIFYWYVPPEKCPWTGCGGPVRPVERQNEKAKQS